jgi:thioesterase domain-containing protein
LERYLHDHIPVSAAMGIHVERIGSDTIVLSAPLDLNVNHHRTAFGGSISALATLAAWSYVHLLLGAREVHAALVIQRHEIDYLKPIAGEFTAESAPAGPDDIRRFFEQIAARGKGRLSVKAAVRFGGQTCAEFVGQFVAIVDSGQE